jgi:hypothetical protein
LGQGAQAATAKMSASADSLEHRLIFRNPLNNKASARIMWPILLEIGLAIVLVAFILWWFRPRRREPDQQGAASGKNESERRGGR